MAARFTFEEGMQELERLVSSLEKGELPLEESFKAFEKGIKLSDRLRKILDDGDARIRELTEQGTKSMDEEETEE